MESLLFLSCFVFDWYLFLTFSWNRSWLIFNATSKLPCKQSNKRMKRRYPLTWIQFIITLRKRYDRFIKLNIIFYAILTRCLNFIKHLSCFQTKIVFFRLNIYLMWVNFSTIFNVLNFCWKLCFSCFMVAVECKNSWNGRLTEASKYNTSKKLSLLGITRKKTIWWHLALNTNFLWKLTFTCAYQRVRNFSFWEVLHKY